MRMSSEINDQLKKGWKLEAHWAARSAFWRLQYFTLPILNLNISNISNIPLFGHSQALRSSESEVSSNRRKGMELFKSVPSAALPSNSIKLSRSEVKRLTSAGLEADKRWWVQRTSAVANAAIPSASVAVRRQCEVTAKSPLLVRNHSVWLHRLRISLSPSSTRKLERLKICIGWEFWTKRLACATAWPTVGR